MKLDIDEIVEEPTEPVTIIWVSVIFALVPLLGGGASMALGEPGGGFFIAVGVACLALNCGYSFGVFNYKEYLRKRKLWNALREDQGIEEMA